LFVFSVPWGATNGTNDSSNANFVYDEINSTSIDWNKVSDITAEVLIFL